MTTTATATVPATWAELVEYCAGFGPDEWVPHPFEVQGGPDTHRRGLPKYLAGPVIEPGWVDGYRIQGCVLVGWCSADRHDGCWQSDGIPTPPHDKDHCHTPHRLCCRCECHTLPATGQSRLF